jgi:hypothetical protein
MMRFSIKPVLAAAALGALAGCATTLETAPGYYKYEAGFASTAPRVTTSPTVVYREPAVVYSEPALVYSQPSVVYREPTVVERRTIIERAP